MRVNAVTLERMRVENPAKALGEVASDHELAAKL